MIAITITNNSDYNTNHITAIIINNIACAVGSNP